MANPSESNGAYPHLDTHVEVPGMGTVRLDVAYGGAFFAVVDARSLGFEVVPHEARDLVATGLRGTGIRQTVRR